MVYLVDLCSHISFTVKCSNKYLLDLIRLIDKLCFSDCTFIQTFKNRPLIFSYRMYFIANIFYSVLLLNFYTVHFYTSIFISCLRAEWFVNKYAGIICIYITTTNKHIVYVSVTKILILLRVWVFPSSKSWHRRSVRWERRIVTG